MTKIKFNPIVERANIQKTDGPHSEDNEAMRRTNVHASEMDRRVSLSVKERAHIASVMDTDKNI